ncbi:hypothetical protein RRF57_011508 [Xylaria bambusicola]|uniref:Uncharacterized protein n=1 Tax=Xylaria bambusicola TaxID=326684 RepID=A0AAN7ZD81_9PEZI
MADVITDFIDVQKDFIKDGTQFINRCTKPDRNEYIKICQAVGVGFVVCSKHLIHSLRYERGWTNIRI